MSDFHHLTLEETAARIRGGVDTLIVFHRHPDGDAVGTGFALRLLCEALLCRALCVCEDELPARLRFLVGYAQESILYASLPADFAPTQIIAVDTASPAQMGSLFPVLGDRVDLMIDHHERGEMYADGWIAPDRAAAGQMVYELSRELVCTGRLEAVPAGVDRLLYAALSSDTGCFRYSNADPSAHRAAAELLEAGFDAADINHRLFGVKSRELLLAERVGFDRLKTFADGRIGVTDMPIDVQRAYGLTDEHMGTLIEVPRSLAGVEVAVAIRQTEDEEPTYRVSMRATGGVDVAAVCAVFGGGGHVRAAGCTVTGEGEMETVIARLVAEIEKAMGV